MSAKKSRVGSIVEYEDGKFWFHLKGNVLTLGITVDSVDQLGEIESIRLPEDGDDLDRDDVVCEVHGSDDKIKLVTPAAGFVLEVNRSVEDDTMIVNEDPIDEGWLVKIEVQDETDLKEYL